MVLSVNKYIRFFDCFFNIYFLEIILQTIYIEFMKLNAVL